MEDSAPHEDAKPKRGNCPRQRTVDDATRRWPKSQGESCALQILTTWNGVCERAARISGTMATHLPELFLENSREQSGCSRPFMIKGLYATKLGERPPQVWRAP